MQGAHAAGTAEAPLAWGKAAARGTAGAGGTRGLEAGLGTARGQQHRAELLSPWTFLPPRRLDLMCWLHCLGHRLCSPSHCGRGAGPLLPVSSVLDLPSRCGVDSTADLTQTCPSVACPGHQRTVNQEKPGRGPSAALPRTSPLGASVCPHLLPHPPPPGPVP